MVDEIEVDIKTAEDPRDIVVASRPKDSRNESEKAKSKEILKAVKKFVGDFNENHIYMGRGNQAYVLFELLDPSMVVIRFGNPTLQAAFMDGLAKRISELSNDTVKYSVSVPPPPLDRTASSPAPSTTGIAPPPSVSTTAKVSKALTSEAPKSTGPSTTAGSAKDKPQLLKTRSTPTPILPKKTPAVAARVKYLIATGKLKRRPGKKVPPSPAQVEKGVARSTPRKPPSISTPDRSGSGSTPRA